MRNIQQALGALPEELARRASALIPAIIVLPPTALNLDGASFDSSRAVLVFHSETDDDGEERLTVLHEVAHVLDPGWEHRELAEALVADKANLPAKLRKRLTRDARLGDGIFESFAELAAWEMAGVKELKYLPRAGEIVHAALHWEN